MSHSLNRGEIIFYCRTLYQKTLFQSSFKIPYRKTLHFMMIYCKRNQLYLHISINITFDKAATDLSPTRCIENQLQNSKKFNSLFLNCRILYLILFHFVELISCCEILSYITYNLFRLIYFCFVSLSQAIYLIMYYMKGFIQLLTTLQMKKTMHCNSQSKCTMLFNYLLYILLALM